VRDRRYDFLYEREKQPVKGYVLERFAEHLASELSRWPPPFVEWVSDELRRRYAVGLSERPREPVLRFALRVARLDLAREFEAVDQLMAGEAAAHWQTEAEAAAGHLLVRFLTEKALSLKEYAEGVPLSRADLIAMLDDVERRLGRIAG
jgi:Ser/Thr protein kinase RdoA (MazF antagonist)